MDGKGGNLEKLEVHPGTNLGGSLENWGRNLREGEK